MNGSRLSGRKYLMLSRGKGRDSAEKRIVFPMKLEGDHNRKGITRMRLTTAEQMSIRYLPSFCFRSSSSIGPPGNGFDARLRPRVTPASIVFRLEAR